MTGGSGWRSLHLLETFINKVIWMQTALTEVQTAGYPLRGLGSMSPASTSMKNRISVSIKTTGVFLLGWFWGFFIHVTLLSAFHNKTIDPIGKTQKYLMYYERYKLPTVGLSNSGPGSMRHPMSWTSCYSPNMKSSRINNG